MINETIRKRKSIRKYDLTKLDDATLDKVRAKAESAMPLYPEIRYSTEIINKTRGIFNVKAPHYLIFSSEKTEGYLENIGFIGQQLDLFFSENGLGACWLGMAKPTETENTELPYVIAIGFGKPAEPLHRDLAEFKRKSLEEISEGSDERLEAARLAPSGMNAQTWFFDATLSKIHCYRKKVLLKFRNELSAIDMGIALCHIAQESDDFRFMKETYALQRKGHIYMGTVL